MAKQKSAKTSAALGRGKQRQEIRDAYSDSQAILRGKEKGVIGAKRSSAFKGAVSIMANQKKRKGE